MSDFTRFLKIRQMYADVLPRWMDEYEKTGQMHHDPYLSDLPMAFTPIESSVWSDIRDAGVPFYPQIPVLNYFIDFGCPFLKIGIECDGKAWHDHDLDKARDARLAAAGWTIFRIEGHECKRLIEDPTLEENPDVHQVHKWFMATSQGVVYAIKQRYFESTPTGFAANHEFIIDSTLFNHCSTPGVVVPQRIERMKSSGPVRASEFIGGYLELLLRRMEAA